MAIMDLQRGAPFNQAVEIASAGTKVECEIAWPCKFLLEFVFLRFHGA